MTGIILQWTAKLKLGANNLRNRQTNSTVTPASHTSCDLLLGMQFVSFSFCCISDAGGFPFCLLHICPCRGSDQTFQCFSGILMWTKSELITLMVFEPHFVHQSPQRIKAWIPVVGDAGAGQQEHWH